MFEELDKIIDYCTLQVPTESKQTEGLICPITLEVFKEPVVDNCGHTFEKEAIEKVLQTGSACPKSRQP